jgi:hypothetical protein
MYNVLRAEGREVLVQHEYTVHRDGTDSVVEYLTFPKIENTGIVKHLFTTRIGGVSKGYLASMNLNFNRGDNPDNVIENYRRIGEIMGITPENMVLSMQTHTTNIRRVYLKDAGKGVTKPLDYQDVDGLVTNEKGLALVTSYADCVPLYFVDKKHQAIGLAHSGWKGTVSGIGAKLLETLNAEFGSKPDDIVAAIGPSICRDCYEVSEDVAETFKEKFADDMELLKTVAEMGYRSGYSNAEPKVVIQGRSEGKYQLDLWLANILILLRAGIPAENIDVTDICTCHNPDYLFSHRASQGRRGNLSAFLMLR